MVPLKHPVLGCLSGPGAAGRGLGEPRQKKPVPRNAYARDASRVPRNVTAATQGLCGQGRDRLKHLHGKASAVQRLIAVGTHTGDRAMGKAISILMGVVDDLYDTHEVEAGCWALRIEEAIRLLNLAQQSAQDQDQEEG